MRPPGSRPRARAAAAREAFEGAMSDCLPQVVDVPVGKEIAYWYNYGLLNISFEVPKKKTAKKSSNAISFK